MVRGRAWFEAEPWRNSPELLERLQGEHLGVYLDGGAPVGGVRMTRAALPLKTSRPGVSAIGDVRAGSTKRVAAAVVAHARWMAGQRAWVMSAAEAETFFTRSHAWLDQARNHTEIAVDGELWLVGFVQGAPCRRGGAPQP